jgi:hypothetical protein
VQRVPTHTAAGDKAYSLGAPILMVRVGESRHQDPHSGELALTEPALRGDLLDGQQRCVTLTTTYGVLSAYILDLEPGNAEVLALAPRFSHLNAGGRVAPSDGDNFLALQSVSSRAGERTQQNDMMSHVLPLFGAGGPAKLRALLSLGESGNLYRNIVVIYHWLEALSGEPLSGLPATVPQQRVLEPMPALLKPLAGVKRLLALLRHLETNVVLSPQLLNLDFMASASHRLFASVNSTGLQLSDMEMLLNAVYYKANPGGAAKIAPAARLVLADWQQWTASFESPEAMEHMLNAMRWVEQAASDGDVSGKPLRGTELRDYFLDPPSEGRCVYTWLDYENLQENGAPTRQCAHEHPIPFVRHLKRWKEAVERLAACRASIPAARNALEVIKCAGGTDVGAAPQEVAAAASVADEADDAEAEVDMGTTASCGVLLSLALAFHVRRSPPAEFARLLERLEGFVAALRLAKPPPQNGRGGKNHLRDRSRLKRLAAVAAELRKHDPENLGASDRGLLAVMKLHEDCLEGVSPSRLARTLLLSEMYTNGGMQRCRFVLAAVEAAAHAERPRAQRAVTQAADLEEARLRSQVEHILAQSFSKAKRALWEADGWLESEAAAEATVHMLGNLVLLPKLSDGKVQYLNQLLGDDHYTAKRETLRRLYGGAFPFRHLSHLVAQHERWTPADFVARHLGLVATLALRWGVSEALKEELRAAAQTATSHDAPPVALLFTAPRMLLAAGVLDGFLGTQPAADLIRSALAQAAAAGAAGTEAQHGGRAQQAPAAAAPVAHGARRAADGEASPAAKRRKIAAAPPPAPPPASLAAATLSSSSDAAGLLSGKTYNQLEWLYGAAGGKLRLPMTKGGRPSARGYCERLQDLPAAQLAHLLQCLDAEEAKSGEGIPPTNGGLAASAATAAPEPEPAPKPRSRPSTVAATAATIFAAAAREGPPPPSALDLQAPFAAAAGFSPVSPSPLPFAVRSRPGPAEAPVPAATSAPPPPAQDAAGAADKGDHEVITISDDDEEPAADKHEDTTTTTEKSVWDAQGFVYRGKAFTNTRRSWAELEAKAREARTFPATVAALQLNLPPSGSSPLYAVLKVQYERHTNKAWTSLGFSKRRAKAAVAVAT